MRNAWKAAKAAKVAKATVCAAQNYPVVSLSWCFVKLLYLPQRQVVKNAFSWGLHFSVYAFAQEKLLTMVKNAFSWASNNEISIFIPN